MMTTDDNGWAGVEFGSRVEHSFHAFTFWVMTTIDHTKLYLWSLPEAAEAPQQRGRWDTHSPLRCSISAKPFSRLVATSEEFSCRAEFKVIHKSQKVCPHKITALKDRNRDEADMLGLRLREMRQQGMRWNFRWVFALKCWVSHENKNTQVQTGSSFMNKAVPSVIPL